MAMLNNQMIDPQILPVIPQPTAAPKISPVTLHPPAHPHAGMTSLQPSRGDLRCSTWSYLGRSKCRGECETDGAMMMDDLVEFSWVIAIIIKLMGCCISLGYHWDNTKSGNHSGWMFMRF